MSPQICTLTGVLSGSPTTSSSDAGHAIAGVSLSLRPQVDDIVGIRGVALRRPRGGGPAGAGRRGLLGQSLHHVLQRVGIRAPSP